MKFANLVAPALFSLALGAAPQAFAQKICVFDILGAQGDIYSIMKDYQLAANNFGASIELKPYTDEKIAAEDFKAGQCDGVMIMGLRARQFNKFTGSLEALGALPSYAALKTVITTLSAPKASKFMINGPYEVAGIVPMGAAYLFVNDRTIDNISKLSGKKFAIMDYDNAQAKMVQRIGAQPVASDVTNFAGKFNNGSVDVVGAPAAAYKPLELQKGMGERGGVARFPVLQLTYQLVIRPDRFPEGFGQKSREYALGQYDRAMSIVKQSESEIDNRYWIDIPPEDMEKYTVMLREARISLTDEGIYDKRMMAVMKRVRCQLNPADAECAQNLE
ncbi:putative solute-binding protein [Pseudomonas sp. NCHU5208]|uniref:putative solute-binding protein n=1 Tax=unclassified Pseudomonas TaxID=196821 RepID=UPI003F98A589